MDTLDFHLFVSYARADNARGWVTCLVDRLREQFAADAPGPLRVFFDRSAIRAGRGWEDEILGGLRVSRAFLAILSPHYFASDWCRREWAWWTRHEMHRHCIRDGAAPIYYLTVDGFPAPKSAAEIAAWVVAQDLRPGDLAAQDRPAIERTVKLFQPRQAYDFRPFDDEALATLAEQALRDRLRALSAQVRDVLDRAERAARSPTDLPAYNPAFCGRLDDLLALRRDLALGATGVTAVVHGLGGIGKTELALAYAHAYGHEYPGGRYLVPCAGVVDWRGALDRFADLHGWAFDDKVKADADLHFALLVNMLHEFAEQRGRCLLLCDNVDHADLVRPGKIAQIRLRNDRFHLLFTTRLPAPPDAGVTANLRWHALDSLPQEDATTLLETIIHACPPAERPALGELAKELGGFTIAVELTGRYLVGNPADPPGALLARLRAATLPELGDKAGRTGADLFRHGEEARLDFILGQTLAILSPAEVRLLEYAAQFAPDAVPLDWARRLLAADFPEFARENGAAADRSWTRLAEKLSSMRLLMRKKRPAEPGGTTARGEVDANDPIALSMIHRLVQAVLRARCGAQAVARRRAVYQISLAASKALSERWHEPRHRWQFPVHEAFADAWLTRVERGETDLAGDAALVANLAQRPLEKVAAWNRAEALLRRAVAVVQAHDKGNAVLPVLISNLATVLNACGRFGEAETCFRQALSLMEASHGTNSPETAAIMGSLGDFLQRTNRLREAEELCRRVLSMEDKIVVHDPALIARTLNNLSLCLIRTNRDAEAESAIRRAVALHERILGGKHPDLATNLHNLASVLERMGRSAEAEPLYRRSLAILEATVGPEHPNVAATMNHLATNLQHAGRLAEAEDLFRRALATMEQVAGQDHPDVSTALNNLAGLLMCSERLAEAEPFLVRALRIAEKRFEPDHPSVAVSLNNLACLFQCTNRLTEAEPLFRRALVIYARFTAETGSEHPNLSDALSMYRKNLLEAGLSEAASFERLCSALAECREDGAEIAALFRELQALQRDGDPDGPMAEEVGVRALQTHHALANSPLLREASRILRQRRGGRGVDPARLSLALGAAVDGDRDRAMGEWRRLERACRASGDAPGLTACLANQASLLAECEKRTGEASVLASEAHELATREGLTDLARHLSSLPHARPDVLAALEREDRSSLNRLFQQRMQEMNLDHAMAIGRIAERRFRKDADAFALAAILANQATILRMSRSFHEALAVCDEAERLFRELDDRQHLAFSLHTKAYLLATRKPRQAEAAAAAQEAYELATALGLSSLAADARKLLSGAGSEEAPEGPDEAPETGEAPPEIQDDPSEASSGGDAEPAAEGSPPGPETIRHFYEAARGLSQAGDALRAQGDTAEALRAYQATLVMATQGMRAEPANTDWARGAVDCHFKIGDLLRARGDRTEAWLSYESAFGVLEALCRAEPEELVWRRAQALGYEKVGNWMLETGDLDAASKAFQTALAQREELARDHPAVRRDVSVCQVMLGDVLAQRKDFPAALEAYRGALAIIEGLAAADPDNTALARDRWVTQARMGEILEQLEPAAAVESWRQAQAILSGMLQRGDFVAPEDRAFLGELVAMLNDRV